MNNRFFNHIFKIAEAEAKLQLIDRIDEDVATQTMQSIQLMLLQYAENVKIVVKPSQITFDKFLEVLENTKGGFTIYELCKLACKEDPQISVYLGTKWTLEQNWKLKRLVDSLRKHPNVRETNSNPLVFKWFVEPRSQPDAPDAPDAASLNVIDNRYITSDKEDVATPVSKSTSGTSGTSYGNQDIPPKCYWCDFSHFETKEKYDYHCVTRHPGKPGYPGPADIRESGLTPQGMLWEIFLGDLKKNGDEL